jgi:mono/diheme cytochrome c family protein
MSQSALGLPKKGNRTMTKKHPIRTFGAVALTAVIGLGGASLLVGTMITPGYTQAAEMGTTVSPGLVIPPMDPVNGKKLFAAKACVVCHAVNGVGGTDAPKIDAPAMDKEMSPFDFVAKMWNHAPRMIAMQEDEIGGQITFENGQQIADIIAFLHDADTQKTFTEDDIPENIKEHLDEGGMMPVQGGAMMDKR